jgi:cytochrome c5
MKTNKFFFGSIVVFCTVFLIEQAILANFQAVANMMEAPADMSEAAVAERIKPVAQEYVGEAPVVEVAQVEAAPAEAAGGVGEKVVTQVCAMCHASGMMSSPKLDSADDWAPRIEKGLETLYNNAINGINMMPARGGRPDLSDDDIKAAVDHMLAGVQ